MTLTIRSKCWDLVSSCKTFSTTCKDKVLNLFPLKLCSLAGISGVLVYAANYNPWAIGAVSCVDAGLIGLWRHGYKLIKTQEMLIENGLTEKAAKYVAPLMLESGEWEQLFQILECWGCESTLPVAFYLGVDLYSELKRLLPPEASHRFIAEYRKHVAEKKEIGRDLARMICGCKVEKSQEEFSDYLGQLVDRPEISSDPKIRGKVILWRRFLSSTAYHRAFIEPHSFQFIEDTDRPMREAEKVTVDLKKIAAFVDHSGQNPALKKIYPDAKLGTWENAIERNHENPVTILRNFKSYKRALSKIEELSSTGSPEEESLEEDSLFLFCCADQMLNWFENVSFGRNRTDHLRRISHNFQSVRRILQNTEDNKFSHLYKHFCNENKKIVQAIKVLNTVLIEKRAIFREICSEDEMLHLVRFYLEPIILQTTLESHLENFRKIHDSFTKEARKREGHALQQYCQEYRKMAFDYFRFYLFLSDIVDLSKFKFVDSKEQTENLMKKLEKYLFLEGDRFEDLAEESQIASDQPSEQDQRSIDPLDAKKNDSETAGSSSIGSSCSEYIPPPPGPQLIDDIQKKPSGKRKTRKQAQPVSGDPAMTPAGEWDERKLDERKGDPSRIDPQNLKHRKLVSYLKKAGFSPERKKGGSHVTYTNPATGEKITVSGHSGGSVYKKGTARAILKAARS